MCVVRMLHQHVSEAKAEARRKMCVKSREKKIKNTKPPDGKNSLEIASMVQRVLKITSNWAIPSISSTRAEICDEKSWENLCESPPRLRKRFSQLFFSANAFELSSHPRRSEWANLWMLLTILVQEKAIESSWYSISSHASKFLSPQHWKLFPDKKEKRKKCRIFRGRAMQSRVSCSRNETEKNEIINGGVMSLIKEEITAERKTQRLPLKANC